MRTSSKGLCLAFVLVLLGVAAAPASDLAFTFVAVGDTLPDQELAGTRTGPVSYLGDDESEARVFAFLKDGRTSSDEFLETMAELQQEFSERPVTLSLVVSGRCSPAWIDTVCRRCPGVAVLVDTDDLLYGTLGVPLTPVVGIADNDRVLRSYLTYRKINFRRVISAHVRFVLGDIEQGELDRLLAPRGRMRDSVAGSGSRKLKLARLLLKRQKYDMAIQQTQSALEEQPDLAEAYGLLAEIYTAQGDEEAAAVARDKAIELESVTESEAAVADSSTTAADSAMAAPGDSTAVAQPDTAQTSR
jgi:tetratricopeptide (TPR) repeat protein